MINKDSLKKRNQTIYTQRTLLVFSSLIILAIGVWFVFGMIWGQVQKSFSLRAEIKQAELQKNNQIARLEKAKKIMKEFANKEDVKNRLSLSLPSSSDYYQVINEIANLAGLTTVEVKSESFKEKAIISSSRTRKSSKKIEYVPSTSSKIVKPYAIINLNLSGKGTYSQIKSFLGLLEKDIRLMDVREFTMKKKQGFQEENKADPEIEFSLKVDFYRQEK